MSHATQAPPVKEHYTTGLVGIHKVNTNVISRHIQLPTCKDKVHVHEKIGRRTLNSFVQ